MKHAVLTSVAHNIADSLASGMGFLIGVYEIDIHGEAARSNEGFIEVDFLTGTMLGAPASPALVRAVKLYAEALSDLCARQGVSRNRYERLTARYSGRGLHHQVEVIVTDRAGKTSRDIYVGAPAGRPIQVDVKGRRRRLRTLGPEAPG